jgi:FkbM family methyltransferase
MDAVELAQSAVARGAMQKANELAALIELLDGKSPATVVEIGTACGGTLFVWCRIASPEAMIVSIDLPGGPFGGGYPQDQVPLLRSYAGPSQAIHLLSMDSALLDTRIEVERLLAGRPIDLLYIDGDHSYSGVRADFLQYARLVRHGGLIVLHDIIESDINPGVEVPALWAQLARLYECEEVVHHHPADRWGGFGVIRWDASEGAPRLDPSPDGSQLAVSDLIGQPTREPVDEVETLAGPLLVSREDRMIASVLRDCGEWEWAETAYLRAILRPGKTFVDVGAHVGYFSVLGSKGVGPAGRVIAFEPEPRNLDLLRRNLARNRCRNATVIPYAVTSAPGWMSLKLDEENRGAHHLVPPGEAGTTVRCVRLDDVLPETVDVVKVDAQGYDHEVVAGLERTLARNPAMVVIAELSHDELERRGIDPELVVAGYEALGFTMSMFDERGRLERMTARAVLDSARGRDCSVVLERPTEPSLALTDPRSRPRRTAGLVVNETDDGLIVSQPVRRKAHYLNHISAVVFDLCTGENTVSTIIETVQEIYERPGSPAAEVEDCLQQLSAERLVL